MSTEFEISTEYPIHPAAMLFPMLDDAELEKLANDIKQNGQLEPVILYHGEVLDGRNRVAACRIAGIEPKTKEADGNIVSPTLYAMSKNLIRRHLTQSQRGAIAAQIMPMLKEEAKKRQVGSLKQNQQHSPSGPMGPDSETTGRAIELAAKAAQVGKTTVRRALDVQRFDQELFEQIEKGKITARKAQRKVRVAQGKEEPTPNGKTQELSSKQRVEQIRLLSAEGHHDTHIAREIGVRPTQVRRLALAHGITLPHSVSGTTSRKVNINRVLEQTVISAQGLMVSLELVEHQMEQIDKARVAEWVTSLQESLRGLNSLLRKLRKLQ